MTASVTQDLDSAIGGKEDISTYCNEITRTVPDSSHEIDTSGSTFEARAYCKMIMHAAKYPHCRISGLLLSRKTKGTDCAVDVVDSIPLFHQNVGLSPMAEAALAQVDSRLASGCSEGLFISGFYHANHSLAEAPAPDVYSRRMAEKIAENSPVASGTFLVTLDNRHLGLVLQSHALIVRRWSGGEIGKWMSLGREDIYVDDNVLGTASDLVQRKVYKELADFDNHLDCIQQDYMNEEINAEIDRTSKLGGI